MAVAVGISAINALTLSPALCALILLMSLGILTPEEALSGFSNSVVIMMVGLFVVGGAIFQTGLAKYDKRTHNEAGRRQRTAPVSSGYDSYIRYWGHLSATRVR